MHTEGECEIIYERRRSSFQSMCGGEGAITTGAAQAIQATERSYAIWTRLRELMETLIEKLVPQTTVEFSVAAYEELAAALPANSNELAALRQKAYSFAIASSNGQGGPPDSTVREALNHYFPTESEMDRQSIAIVVDTVLNAYKSRLVTVQFDTNFMQLAQLYRALLCGGIWHITGSTLERTERADKLRNAAIALVGEKIPGLGLLVEIAKLIKSWDPNSPLDVVRQAQRLEEYLQLYKRVINEWIQSGDNLESLLSQSIRRY
jgi:hypothetical protein